MTFLKKLQAHIGGLIQLNTQIYWYKSHSYDGVEGRVCLLLGTVSADVLPVGHAFRNLPVDKRFKVLLLIDGSPKCVWVSEETAEFIQ